eukprot:s989_g3.t3
MMDNGYPQTTEVKILREYIKTQSHQLSVDQMRPPTAVTNAVSWRSEGIKHKKNEIFLDVVERLNLLVSANGSVLRSEILGALKMKSYLSGMPELKLGLNDKLLFEATGRPVAKGKSVEMEDIKFHQCVRLARFENDRTISFIPPDGEFELMSYRLNTHVKPLIWVEAVVDPGHSRSRIEYMIKAKSQFKSRSVANNVEIHIPDCIVWSIKQFQGQKDFIMTANFGLPSVGAENRDAYMKAPIDSQVSQNYREVWLSGAPLGALHHPEWGLPASYGLTATSFDNDPEQHHCSAEMAGSILLGSSCPEHSGNLECEHIKIFEFLDHDKNGVVSLDEFHTAVEAAAPVKSLEDLRRKWIALGYTSMRQALLGMDLHKEPGRSFTLAEFGAHLARVGIEEETEHQNIFGAIRDPHSSHQTVTLEMLAAAMSAISPSLLLEDLRDKILKKFGTLSNCFAALDMDQGESLDIGEFIRYAVPAWKLTAHEAGKAFRLIDVDGSLQISKDEFVTALTLSEPNLYLDEIRRKVRQRFRSMRGLLNEGNEDDIEVDEVELKPPPPPAVEIAPSRKGSLYQRHSIVVQDSPRSDGNGGMTAEESRRASWIAKHSGLGAEKAQDLLKDLVGPGSETEDDGRTPEEYQEMLGQVQLSEQDTKALFNLMDVNRDGKLTTTEFEHGVRLFAPSTALEDLRLACISKYGGIPEAFASLRPEQREASLEYHQLKKILEDIRIWDEGTGDLRLIMDIVECTRDGGTSIGELMAALQAGQSGTQARLPAEQRDAKVRQQVKWQMAPFRRCASDLRAHVREKLNAHELEQMWNPRSQESHVADKSKSAALRAETQTAIHKWKRDKSLPALRRIDHDGQDPSWAGLSVAAEEELSSNTIPWGPMRASFSKVFLKTLDTKELRPIINSMHHYYATAGETVTSREAFLNKQQSRYEQFKSCTHHYKLLTRQPGGT